MKLNSIVILVCICHFGNCIYFQSCNFDGFKCPDDDTETVIFDCGHYYDAQETTLSPRRYYYRQRTELQLSGYQQRRDFRKNLTIVNCNDMLVSSSSYYDSSYESFSRVNLINITHLEFNIKKWPKILSVENVSDFQLPKLINSSEFKLVNVKVKNFQQWTYYDQGRRYLKSNLQKFNISKSELPFIPTGALVVETDHFIMKDNKIGLLEPESLLVKSRIVEISGNLIKNLKTGAFRNITAKIQTEKPANNNRKTQIVIENNVIDHLDQKSLDLTDFITKAIPFEKITFSKNQINCTCKNIGWFHSIKNQIYFDQILNDDNLCSNNLNCKLQDIEKNYSQLSPTKKLDENCLYSQIQSDKSIKENINWIKINKELNQYLNNVSNILKTQLINNEIKIEKLKNETKFKLSQIETAMSNFGDKNVTDAKINELNDKLQDIAKISEFQEISNFQEKDEEETVQFNFIVGNLIPQWFFILIAIVITFYAVFSIYKTFMSQSKVLDDSNSDNFKNLQKITLCNSKNSDSNA